MGLQAANLAAASKQGAAAAAAGRVCSSTQYMVTLLETLTLKKSCDVRDAGAQLVVAFDLQTLGSSWIPCYHNCFHAITIAMIVIILTMIGSNSTYHLQYSTHQQHHNYHLRSLRPRNCPCPHHLEWQASQLPADALRYNPSSPTCVTRHTSHVTPHQSHVTHVTCTSFALNSIVTRRAQSLSLLIVTCGTRGA